MNTTTIKNNLEDKIIFGEDKLPTVCRIYTIPFESIEQRLNLKKFGVKLTN